MRPPPTCAWWSVQQHTAGWVNAQLPVQVTLCEGQLNRLADLLLLDVIATNVLERVSWWCGGGVCGGERVFKQQGAGCATSVRCEGAETHGMLTHAAVRRDVHSQSVPRLAVPQAVGVVAPALLQMTRADTCRLPAECCCGMSCANTLPQALGLWSLPG